MFILGYAVEKSELLKERIAAKIESTAFFFLK